jgi:D-sedoheptulose 7-phosphate isomerase
VSWSRAVDRTRALLAGLEVRDEAGAPLPADEGFRRWIAATLALRGTDRSAFLIGNGASAALASHLAADVGKNGRVRTQVFTDPALATALANDLGVEHMFAEPLRLWARAGDVLVAISSSGRSPNVLAACQAARAAGLTVVTLSGMRPDNPLRGLGQLNFWLDATTYGEAESCHGVLLHHWADGVMGAP